MISYGTSWLRVKDSEPVKHCRHSDGTWSVRTTHVHDEFTIYLDGTPEELLDWATKVRFLAAQLLMEEPEEESCPS